MKSTTVHAPKAFKTRFQTKILIGIFVLEVALMSAIILVVDYQMRASISDEFLKRGLSVVRNLTAINSDLVTTYNYVKIDQNLQRIVDENGLLFAAVTLFDGDLASFKGNEFFKDKILADKGFLEAFHNSREPVVRYLDLDQGEACKISMPIFFGSEYWGAVEVGFSLAGSNQAIFRTRMMLLVLGGIGLLCGWFASVVLARHITRPVGHLVRHVQALSSGRGFVEPIRITSTDEIGYLSQQFAALQTTIKKQFQQLRKSNEQLADGNNVLHQAIIKRAANEKALRESEARLANAQRIAKLGYWEWEPRKKLLHWSSELNQMFGLPEQQATGSIKVLLRQLEKKDRVRIKQAIATAMYQHEPVGIEHKLIGESGTERVYRQEIEVRFDEAGRIEKIGATVQDVTERKRSEERIRHLAFYDPITGLPNRLHIVNLLHQWLEQAKSKQTTLAALYLDLDNFKRINDSLGHENGDDLLRQVAGRLTSCIRSTDLAVDNRRVNTVVDCEDGSAAARFGGDEFVIVLSRVKQIEQAIGVARRVKRALAAPFKLQGNEIFVTTSIGISTYPEHGSDAETLLKHADLAMYHAKKRGKDHYRIFSASLDARVQERIELENALRRGLELGQLDVHYQPRIDLQRETVIGMEALVRWHHPTRGMIPPSAFIPVAEETGLIVALGEWVLRTACEQTKAWHAQGFTPLQVSVNLSPVQFREGGLVDTVREVLAQTGLAPQHLELELTETLFMEHKTANRSQLEALKEMGVDLSIDDFGTGYSSLAYLKQFPIDTLKIDRSFIKDVINDDNDATIVNAMIALGHNLGLSVVAEGVDSPKQVVFLKARNCDEVQGYYFSKPLSSDDFINFLNHQAQRKTSPLVRDIASAGKREISVNAPHRIARG